MASSQSSPSNNVADISHVLESLGNLVVELDALEASKVDKVESSENSHCATDVSLEALAADTDEFDDHIQKFLIPLQGSKVQKSPNGFFSQKSHQNINYNLTSPLQRTTLDPACARPTSGGILHSRHSAAQGLRPNEDPTPQRNSLKLQNSASSRTCEPNNDFSVSPEATAKGFSASDSSSSHSRNSESFRKQARAQSHSSVPPSKGGYKSASKVVALGGDVHGSFRKVDEESKASVAVNCLDLPASHSKAEPNHYVAPRELGLTRPAQVQMKPDVQESNVVHNTRLMKQCGSEDVPVNVFNEDDKPVWLLVSPSMNAREACHKLVLLNNTDDDPQWVLVEHLTDLGLERHLEDHENVLEVLNTWACSSNNKLIFRKESYKYHFFAHTSNYFPPHLLDSENSDKAVTEKAQKAKTILHQKLFSTCTRVPEVEGLIHCKEFRKKSWSKKFIFLRGSGLYSSNKGKSKASRDLESYVQFDGANLYSILYPKKSHKAPTEFCFCIVPWRAREFKELKCFCVDDEKTLLSWTVAIRIAKFGQQLRRNYDDMLRKFAKLTRYHNEQDLARNGQNVMSERNGGEINGAAIKEGQVAMDFTGKSGKVITNSKEIQKLSKTRNRVKLSQRTSSENFIQCDTGVVMNEPYPDVLPESPVAVQDLMSEPWYHGRITREQTLKLVLTVGVQDGLFLVRENTTVAGRFVLTFCMNKSVYHCDLVQDIHEGFQTFSLVKGPTFKTLRELILFYQKKPLNGVSLALRIPCPKPEYSGYLES